MPPAKLRRGRRLAANRACAWRKKASRRLSVGGSECGGKVGIKTVPRQKTGLVGWTPSRPALYGTD